MPAGGLVTLGVTAALGGYQYYKSAQEKKKALEAAKRNVRPAYESPASENSLANLVYSQAGQGMSDASRQVYQNAANQGLSATLGAINRGGGDVNSVSSVYGNYEKGMSQLALQDEAIRMKHMGDLASLYQRQTANADKAWQLNSLDPYKDRAAAIAEQARAAQQGENAGLNTIGSAAIGALKNFSAPTKAFHDMSGRSIDPIMTEAPMGIGTLQRPNGPQNVQQLFTPNYPNINPGISSTWNVNQNLFGGYFGGQ